MPAESWDALLSGHPVVDMGSHASWRRRARAGGTLLVAAAVAVLLLSATTGVRRVVLKEGKAGFSDVTNVGEGDEWPSDLPGADGDASSWIVVRPMAFPWRLGSACSVHV